MEYVMPKPQMILAKGEYVLAVSTREFAKRNPVNAKNTHDGYAWNRLGIEQFAQDGKGKIAWAEYKVIKQFFDGKEDGFTMPQNTSHERHHSKTIELLELVRENNEMLKRLLADLAGKNN